MDECGIARGNSNTSAQGRRSHIADRNFGTTHFRIGV